MPSCLCRLRNRDPKRTSNLVQPYEPMKALSEQLDDVLDKKEDELYCFWGFSLSAIGCMRRLVQIGARIQINSNEDGWNRPPLSFDSTLFSKVFFPIT